MKMYKENLQTTFIGNSHLSIYLIYTYKYN